MALEFLHYFNFTTNLLAIIWLSKSEVMLLYLKQVLFVFEYLPNDT